MSPCLLTLPVALLGDIPEKTGFRSLNVPVLQKPGRGKHLRGHVVVGKDPPINLDQCFMPLLVAFHEGHIGSPHVPTHPFQIVAGLAFEKPPTAVEIIGTNDEKVVLSNEVPAQAVTRRPT